MRTALSSVLLIAGTGIAASGCRSVAVNPPAELQTPVIRRLPAGTHLRVAVTTEFADGSHTNHLCRAEDISTRFCDVLGRREGMSFEAVNEFDLDSCIGNYDHVLRFLCAEPAHETKQNPIVMLLLWPATVSFIASPLGVVGLSLRGLVAEEATFDWRIELCRATDIDRPVDTCNVQTQVARVSATGWGASPKALRESYQNADTHMLSQALQFAERIDWSGLTPRTSPPGPAVQAPAPLPSAGEGQRYALLIGIDEYDDRDVASLEYADDDVEALHHVLLNPELGGYKPANVFLMTPGAAREQDQPTRANILLTLKWITEKLQQNDDLLVFYCGHGEVEDGIGFLIPQDGRRALLQDTSIRFERLFALLDKCPASRQVVLLDACHSGGSAKGQRGERGVKVVAKALHDQVENSGNCGRAVITSCSRDEVSYEDEALEHGVFSFFVLKGLRDRSADRDHDDVVTVYELGNYAKTQVELWCKVNRKSPAQTPRLVYRDTSGEIPLIGKPQPASESPR